MARAEYIDGYYTKAQAAAYLGTTPSNIDKLLYRQRILHADINLDGHLLLFSRATLDAFQLVWRRRPRKPALDTNGHV